MLGRTGVASAWRLPVGEWHRGWRIIGASFQILSLPRRRTLGPLRPAFPTMDLHTAIHLAVFSILCSARARRRRPQGGFGRRYTRCGITRGPAEDRRRPHGKGDRRESRGQGGRYLARSPGMTGGSVSLEGLAAKRH